MDAIIVKYALINIVLAMILFYLGRTIHEYGHFFVARWYKIQNIKIDLNFFRDPFKGAKITFDDQYYDRLSKNKKCLLLFSGLIPQNIFYFVVLWLGLSLNIDWRFKFLFTLIMLVLIIPEWIINFKKDGDLNRLVGL